MPTCKECCRFGLYAVALVATILLVFLSERASHEASKYHSLSLNHTVEALAYQARAVMEGDKVSKDKAMAEKDKFEEEADEARAEKDNAKVAEDEAKQSEAITEETAYKVQAAEEESEAAADFAEEVKHETAAAAESAEVDAEKAASDTLQGEAAAAQAEAAESEEKANADEAAEAALTLVPFADVVADTIGTGVAIAFQASAAAEEASAAADETASLADRAQEAADAGKATEEEGQAARAQQQAEEKQKESDSSQEKAEDEEFKAAKYKEYAEKEKADAEEAETDIGVKEADAGKKEADKSVEEEQAEEDENSFAKLTLELMWEHIKAFLFTLLSILAVALPSAYYIVRRIGSSCIGLKRDFHILMPLCIGACGTGFCCSCCSNEAPVGLLTTPLVGEQATLSDKRRWVEPLHRLMLIIGACSIMLPVAARGVETLGKKEVALGSFSHTHRNVTVLEENFEMLFPTIIQEIRNIMGRSILLFAAVLLAEFVVSVERDSGRAFTCMQLFNKFVEAVEVASRWAFFGVALSVLVLSCSRSLWHGWSQYNSFWLPHRGILQFCGLLLAAAIGILQAYIRVKHRPKVLKDAEGVIADVIEDAERAEPPTDHPSTSAAIQATERCAAIVASAINSIALWLIAIASAIVHVVEGLLEAIALWYTWKGIMIAQPILISARPFIQPACTAFLRNHSLNGTHTDWMCNVPL